MAVGTAHQLVDYVGTNITFEAANTNPVFATIDGTTSSSRCFLWVKNTDAASRTVTLAIPGTTFEQANPDAAIVVPSGQERLIGPLDPNLVDPSFLKVLWTYSAAANVTIAVVELPPPPPDLP